MDNCLRSALRRACVVSMIVCTPAVAMADDDDDGPRRRPPDSGFALDARASYETWITGTVAGQPIGSVFSGGAGTQIDVGLLLSRGLTIYAGWDHAFFGAGSLNPYVTAKLPTVSARAEYFMLGVRYGCSNGHSLAGVWLGGDLGYEILHSDASDNSGGSASVDLGNLAGRAGVGACIRPTSGLVLAPSVMMSLLASAGGQSSSVTVNGNTKDTSADINNKSLIVGVAPGLGIQGEF